MMCFSLRRASFILLASAVVACGGKAVVDGSPGEGGGGTGGTTTGTHTGTWTGTTTGTWTGTTTGTWTGTTTGTTTYTNTGGGPGCYETQEGFDMQLMTYDGQMWGCSGGAGGPGFYDLQAVVVEASEGYVLLDSCPPNADCMPMYSELNMTAPGSYQNLWAGTYVELKLWVDYPWGCLDALEIWNLPEWGGVPNPNWSEPALWFAGGDGTLSPVSQLPFTVMTLPLNCYPNEPNCGVPKDDFMLRFAELANPANYVDVPMGQTSSLYLGSSYPPEYYTVRNLRSYESGLCDDNWNYAYWAQMELMYGE